MVVHRFTNEVFFSNSYVLCFETEDSAWVIDPGDTTPIVQCLRNNEKQVAGILLTHSHYDHIYGINSLQEYYPNAKIHAAENAVVGLFSSKHNMSRYHLQPYCVKQQDVICVSEGMQIKVSSNLSIKILYTPGHHPGCLSFEIGDELFTGDSLIPGIKVVTILPGGDKMVAKRSIERIFKQYGKSMRVWPGHGEECFLRDINMESCLINM